MKKLLIVLLLLSNVKGYSQKYNTATIPDSLKKNADAVKRFEELKVTIKSTSKGIVTRKYAITILNEEGAKFALYQNDYNKLQSLENISGHLYDASGKEIKSVKKKDIADYSAFDNVSLVTDNRIKRHNFYYNSYPYTIEYEDEQELNGIFFLPRWDPLEDTRLSVEQSSFLVETPVDFDLRIKQFAFDEKPIILTAGSKKSYAWKISYLRALVQEPYQPSWEALSPSILIAPSQFEIQDYPGDMSSWLNLGKFINTLNSNRQQLPENIKQDVHRLTDALTNTTEKIKVLYEYLQKNTRYISIQLGIGGWQPFDANYVATKKYGDCKALSNYMVSLLKEAHISAKYVLITAGENRLGLRDDFPAPYFNHAIVCVPQPKDSIWLECTSQTVSAGYMGNFTGNRKALLIDDDGGHVVKTPGYKTNDNLQIRKVIAVINEEGTLNAQVVTRFTGLQQDDMHSLMNEATPEQKKRYLNNTLSLPTYTVENFEYTETKGMLPEVLEKLSITAPNYANITGKRLFIAPNFFNKSASKLPEDSNRKYDLQFNTSYRDEDSIQITIPANYIVETMPKEVSIKNIYGAYSIKFNVKDNFINVVRKNERAEGYFSKKEYNNILKFFNDIYSADRGRIVLVKKES